MAINSADMATNLIFRAKNLQEFTVTTEVPDDFSFRGVIPFDMSIKGTQMEAKVWAIDFDEAVHRLNEFLQNTD
jgi:hypothetical protein